MEVFKETEALKAWLQRQREDSKNLGFVPTMGALHYGHLALVEAASKQCDVVLVSIYVNPTQFNRLDDFDKYPRTIEKDLELLNQTRCSAVFIPQDAEIYPDNKAEENIDFGYLETVLEGKYRPGHFKGVGRVLKRFFEMIEPNKAFFGLKDYQQVLVVKSLVKKFGFKTQIIALPTVREQSGLAMSSRNRLLSEEEKKIALNLYKALLYAKENYGKQSISEIKDYVFLNFLTHPAISPEYFEFAEADTLKLLDETIKPDISVVALVAAFVGKTRLIDNLLI